MSPFAWNGRTTSASARRGPRRPDAVTHRDELCLRKLEVMKASDERGPPCRRAEGGKRPSHPRDDMRTGRDHRGRNEREPAVDRKKVAMNRTGEALEPVPAEPRAPVEPRFEERAHDRRAGREDERADEHPRGTETRPA